LKNQVTKSSYLLKRNHINHFEKSLFYAGLQTLMVLGAVDLTFNQVVRGSSPRWLMKTPNPLIFVDLAFFLGYLTICRKVV